MLKIISIQTIMKTAKYNKQNMNSEYLHFNFKLLFQVIKNEKHAKKYIAKLFSKQSASRKQKQSTI